VVAQQEPSAETSLVAYFVSAAGPSPSITELQRFLREKLPVYMVPSAFVRLDRIPLTPNGKVDRNALPSAGHSRPALDAPFIRPRTTIERELAQIWAEVLSLGEVGVDDNFFDLGGHSLKATQIISRVIRRFELELPVQFLLDAPTVAEMAVVITQNQAKKAGEGDLNRMLTELEALSDQEAAQQLNQKAKVSPEPNKYD
jgi:acyl carrier protein